MRISAKGRYALAAMTYLAQNYAAKQPVTVLRISEHLNISKIYLEQVFSLLKRGKLVLSAKGAQGGYTLARDPGQITALEVLSAVELSLFEKAGDTVSDSAPGIESAICTAVLEPLDQAVKAALEHVTLADMQAKAASFQAHTSPMYYI